MSVIVCGSLAYDTIMVFHDRFKHHILPEQMHILNVSFQVPVMRREFGGCAGNIAYNLKLLDVPAWPLAAAGKDFATYAAWFERCRIDNRYVRVLEDSYTAQAFITTDLDANQITAFHPGAMNRAHEIPIPTDAGAKLALIAPDGREGMLQHAAQCVAAGIPFVFDPGQGMPLFNGPELLQFIAQADWAILNDYESQMLQERTGVSLDSLAARLRALIVTQGGNGSQIYAGGQRFDIPAVPVRTVVDPTGCGDAYRAGIVYGILNNLDWPTTGRLASLMGAVKVECAGTQNHSLNLDAARIRFREIFGYEF